MKGIMAAIYKEGSRGEAVKQIQKALRLQPDGIFGALTKEALMTWQRSHGLTPDGIAGPATLAKLLPERIGVAMTLPHDGRPSHWGFTLKKSRRKITDIVVHCTATREGQAMTIDQIRAEHKKQGWSDVGYHYVVMLDGKVELGRDVDIVGAHVAGHNSYSIGIAYVGGLENKPLPYNKLKAKDTRTDQQKAALLSLLLELRKLYPNARISGHRDFSPDKNGDGIISPCEWIKACPSFDAKTEYRKV
jgi:hypothetical protein